MDQNESKFGVWFWCAIGMAALVPTILWGMRLSGSLPTRTAATVADDGFQEMGCLIEEPFSETLIRTGLLVGPVAGPVIGAGSIWIIVRLVNRRRRVRQASHPDSDAP